MQTDLFENNLDSSDILTVSQLTREIKGLLERNFPPLWIRGEISNLRIQPSGHCYFVLKDSKSQIKAVLFKGDFTHLGCNPLDGDEYIAFGNLSVYEPRGDYQFRVKHLMQDGIGNLRLQFDQLKEKLLNEGLFEEERKNSLPTTTRNVAVVTSIRGAALQDFLSILKRKRWTGKVSIFPSSVQGRDAPAELLRALELTNLGNFDLTILTRGGGAIEDLWAFNNEALVRAVASYKTPIISAIGHQTDFVLTDFASDFRAETPSAAAEWITSQNTKQHDIIDNLQKRFQEIPNQRLTQLNEKLLFLGKQLENNSPQSKVEIYHQYLDEFSHRMNQVIKNSISQNLYQVNSLGERLKGNSLQSVLNRGFSFIEGLDGSPVDLARKLTKGDSVRVVFKDGKRTMNVQD